MKTPIKPEEIREGDMVICASNGFESHFTVDHIDTGRAYALPGNDGPRPDAFLWLRESEGQRWFLVDRPAPLVEVPKVPTLGWMTYRDPEFPDSKPDVELGEWRLMHNEPQRAYDDFGATSVPLKWITSFVPATAVPTVAVDKLTEAAAKWRQDASYRFIASDVHGFLAAIGEVEQS